MTWSPPSWRSRRSQASPPTAPSSTGTPCATRCVAASNFSAGVRLEANARARSSWSAARTLTANLRAATTAGSVRESRSKHTSRRTGSSESDATAFVVRPAGPSGPWQVTTVTPVGKWPMTCRKRSRSGAMGGGRTVAANHASEPGAGLNGGNQTGRRRALQAAPGAAQRERSRMMPPPMVRRRLLLGALPVAAAGILAACGSEGISTSITANSEVPASVKHGAQLFSDRCAGCHNLDVVGAQGGALQIKDRERVDGPNFNVRKEDVNSVLYAIRNGGFSGAIMPQNIVVGQD